MSKEQTSLASTQTERVPTNILTILKELDVENLTEHSLPETIDRVLGADHPQIVKVLHWLAVLHHSRNDFGKAEFLYRRALEIADRTFSPFNSESGLIMNNLGRVLHDQKKIEEAEGIYRRSHAVLRQALGTDHPRLAKPLINLASLYWEQGKRVEAERLFKHSIALLEEAHGMKHPKVIKAANRIEGIKAGSVAPVTL